MADFVSSRFTPFNGDSRLHDILNSPEPNSSHLQRYDTGADHGNDVYVLQNAFYDLGWTMRIQPPEPVFTEMVTDYFGDKTYAVALAYKTHYGLVTPGTSTFTGNVGPQTLAKVDFQCTLYDASFQRIIEKVDALENEQPGSILLGEEPGPNPMTILGTSAVYWAGTYYGSYGHLCDEADTGTWVVHGPIYARWADEGWIPGPLGLPITDVVAYDDGTSDCTFEYGRITLDAAGDTSVEYWD